MKRILLALGLLLCLLDSAQAQNVQCTTRPAGDNTNACASTEFVRDAFESIFISVMDYCTVADIASDAAVCMQNAINAAANKALYIPQGNYVVTGSGAQVFTCNSPITIFGDGLGSLIIPTGIPATRDIFHCAPTVTSTGWTFRNFAIQGAAAVHLGRHAIHLDADTADIGSIHVEDMIILPTASGNSLYGHSSSCTTGSGGIYAQTAIIERNLWESVNLVCVGDGVTVRNNTINNRATAVTSTVTMTIASPGVVTWTANPLSNGMPIIFTTTGALPTGFVVNTAYYVVNQATNTFQLAATPGGTAINTSGSQSGVHTAILGNPGIYSSQVLGAAGLQIIGNNIAAYYGHIIIDSGVAPMLRDNELETPTGINNPYGSQLHVKGAVGALSSLSVSAPQIVGNAISTLTSSGDPIPILLGNTTNASITGGRLAVMTGAHISIGAASDATVMDATTQYTTNFVIGGSTVTNNGTNTAWNQIFSSPTGTSGGIPYYVASTRLFSSAQLAIGQLVAGGGAGAAPFTIGAGSTGQLLQSTGGGSAPVYTTATYPATTTVNQLLYSSSTNVVAGLATGNSGVLITSAGGVPSISSTLPSGLAIPSPTLSGTVAGANTIPLTILAQSAANTMLGNWTGSTANVAANAMPSCPDTTGNHLNYVSGTGITCGTSTVATLGVGAGGTGTSTAFTLGSVVFAGASGVYTQDNSNFFWDNTNNRLGINQTSPSRNIEVGTTGMNYIRITTNLTTNDAAYESADGTNDFLFGILAASGCGTGNWAIFAGSCRVTVNGSTGLVTLSNDLTLTNLATDATHTDRTVCQDTTSKTLFFGSGALGVCLGTSGAQFKTAFAPMAAGLDEIMKVDLQTYRYRNGYGDDGQRVQYGPTAQSVEAAIPDLARHNSAGETINYDSGALLFIGLRAIQQLKADNDNLRIEIESLKRKQRRK